MAREIHIERLACTGCDICVEMVPDVFELDDEAVAVVHNRRGDTDAAIQDAIDACPESCIHWREVR